MSGRPLSIGHQTGLNCPHSSLPHLSSTSGSAPTPRRKAHYRPFSAQSPYTDIATAQSSSCLRRSVSVGGLHQFCNNMGLQFGSKGRKELVPPNSPVLPSVPNVRPTYKISVASIFGTTDAAPSSPPNCPDELPVINISQNRVSSEELDACGNFVPKNIWAKRCKMKLHPYHKQVAYMRAYDPISLESDRYTELLFQRLTNGSPSFHDYGKKPPATVLDLGCGQGHWILHGANVWRNTEFIGVDIVDTTLPTFKTVENVSLVRGDFLNYKLPFPDNTFDFVRIANLTLCIPYDKWEFVLNQVHRVLMPGGRLELIDDDLYFPYGEGWKGVEALPASPLTGSFFGDERLELGMDVRDTETGQREDTEDDSMSMNPIMAGATDSSLLSDTSRNPDSTPRCKRTDLKPAISPRSPTPRVQRQPSGSKTISRSTTLRIGVPPSPTTRKEGKFGNPSPCPKRTQEKVALLPSIRSITPACSLSSGSTYSPTWSLRTANSSPSRSDASSIRTMDTSPTTSIGSVVNQVDSDNSEWQRKVSTSKNMESLFEKMLIEQYGIHPRPSEFMLRVLGKVFQEDGARQTRVRMKKSFHIKLAPTETIADKIDSDYVRGEERGGMEEADGMASTSTGTSPTFSTVDPNSKPQKQKGVSITTLRPRPWQQRKDKKLKEKQPRSKKDEDKKNKSKQEEEHGRQPKLENPQGAVNTTAPIAVSLFKRSQHHDPAMSTPVRPALSAKAAGILGIPYSELSAVTLSLSRSSSKERRSPAMPLPWSFSSNLSAKAAGRLGIPYSEALSAAASLFVPPNATHLTIPSFTSTLSPTPGSEANTTPEFVQHPGLLIWPDTYVPMTAGELEMHACKYIHTLLSCRPALEEFVAKFVDERGDRLVGEEELSDEIWEYECFRRGRFNWPSEAAEPYEDDPMNPNAAGASFPACAMPVSSGVGTGGTVDANHSTASTLDLPAVITTGSASGNGPLLSKTTTPQLRATNEFGGFSNEKSSLLSRSSSPNRLRTPLFSSMPMKARSKMMHWSNSRPASPMLSSPPLPSCSRMAPDDESYGSMTEGNRDYRKLDDLVHLRWISVFEGIKAP